MQLYMKIVKKMLKVNSKSYFISILQIKPMKSLLYSSSFV